MLMIIVMAAIGGLAFAAGVGSLIYGYARHVLCDLGWYAVMSLAVSVFTIATAVSFASSDPVTHDMSLRVRIFCCLPYLLALLALFHRMSQREFTWVDWSVLSLSGPVFMFAAMGPYGLSDGSGMRVDRLSVFGGDSIWFSSFTPNAWLLRVFFMVSACHVLRCLFLGWVARNRDRVAACILLSLAAGLVAVTVYHFGLLSNLWRGVPIGPFVFLIAYAMLGVEIFRRDRWLLSENERLYTEQRNAEQTLRLLVEGTAKSTGSEFFPSLTKHLAQALGFRYVLVGELANHDCIQTVSYFGNGEHLENCRYELAGTPCENVIRQTACFHGDQVQEKFPEDEMLREMGVVSYIGAPLVSSAGESIGLLSAFDDKPTEFRSALQSTFEIFAARASAELERTTAERQLRDNEERFRTLATHAPVGIAVADAGGYATYFNAECARIVGLPVEQCLGSGWIGQLHEDDRDRIVTLWKDAISSEVTFHSEHRFQSEDGTFRWAHVVAVPQGISANDERAWFVIALDITEQRLAEQRLDEQQAMLAHASRLSTMGEMVAGIAHELNQPLSAISNFARACNNVLASDNQDLRASMEEWLTAIGDQALRCGEIIRGLREFLKKSDQHFSWINLNDVIDDSIALVRSDRRQRDVSMECRVANSLPRVLGNKIQLQQVVVNLLRNACDATEGQPEPRVRVGIRTTGDEVQITVEDNGTGVPSHLRDRLFDPFFTTKSDGLGMGLAISKTIIEAHEGHLRFDPPNQIGSRFQIDLPAREPAQCMASTQ